MNPEFEFAGGLLQPLGPKPALINGAHQRSVEAIADGSFAPGPRIRQEELGRIPVSRQPSNKDSRRIAGVVEARPPLFSSGENRHAARLGAIPAVR